MQAAGVEHLYILYHKAKDWRRHQPMHENGKPMITQGRAEDLDAELDDMLLLVKKQIGQILDKPIQNDRFQQFLNEVSEKFACRLAINYLPTALVADIKPPTMTFDGWYGLLVDRLSCIWELSESVKEDVVYARLKILEEKHTELPSGNRARATAILNIVYQDNLKVRIWVAEEEVKLSKLSTFIQFRPN